MTYLVDTDYIADYLKGYKAATTLLNSLLIIFREKRVSTTAYEQKQKY